ncbi:MAG: PatB family C-S lyase [Opitutales bacterium]|nr:PatB family C-S lyase [Opitutales bacterium]
MEYDFASCPDRSGTGSLKWQKYAGGEVLPFWVADMDFGSAPEVLEALSARTRHGVFGYTLPPAETVDAVVDYLRRDHGLAVEPKWLVWLPGLVPALNTAARAYAEREESVMTCVPVYPPFLTAPGNQGRRCLQVPLAVADGRYTFDFEAMEAAVRPDTRVFFLCNPHNPVGRVFTRAELEAVVAFCRRHNLVLISDEIHCDLILDDAALHIPTLALGGVEDLTVTLMAPSKTYNLPGLACSFVIAPDARLRARFERACRGMITEVNCFGYTGCAAAFRHGEPWRQALLKVLRANRDRVYAFAEDEMPELGILPMEATYLAWFDVRPLGLRRPDAHFEEHGIGLSDGGAFGTPGFLRLNFGCPSAQLEEGLRRMKRAYDAALTARAAV